MKRTGTAIALIVLLTMTSASADRPIPTSGPMSLVIRYRARQDKRVEFAEYMAGQGVLQFDWWHQSGYFSDYRLLLPTTASETSWDALAVLTFDDIETFNYWLRMEERYPGGLDGVGLELGTPERTFLCEEAYDGGDLPMISTSTYMVKPYRFEKESTYRSFCDAYLIPEFTKWQESGALRNYWVYINRVPAGTDWEVLLVLEYNDPGNRSSAKRHADTELSSEPGWNLLNSIKSQTRFSDEERIVARPIQPQ